jgi:Mlc titration factor MtfA (ptsG expression regulator)
MFDFLKAPRRRALRETPLSAEQWALVEDRVPLVRKLGPADRARLGGLVQIFLAEKTFEGGGGFTITDEVKLVIAAEACLLLVHRDVDVPYPDLVSIVVYPSAWRTKRRTRAGGGAVVEQEGVNLGESWSKDLVVLAWDRVKNDARNASDGHNVVLHEFAHQLDAEDGSVDGAPELPDRKRYAQWAKAFQPEFEALQEGLPSDIDRYGATNPAEFFAVVTEEFYEQPHALAENHPGLFRELVKFYGFDPRA